MIKTLILKLIRAYGYELRHKHEDVRKPNGVELYSYLDEHGEFDYETYRQVQSHGNKKKIDHVWAIEENISFLADHIRKHIGARDDIFGICHGTRRGKEQEWFMKYLGGNVIGTEISDTATDFPHTIQWDFHDAKQEWIDSVDFIYSNSFDHSYDPEKCLNVWMSCVRKGGICILEHTYSSIKATPLDPFGAPVSFMPYLVLLWGKGKYCVREILFAPVKKKGRGYIQFLVIQRL